MSAPAGDLRVSPAPAEPIYLTASQVARLLQVHKSSVFRWAEADPSLPVLRIGGAVRFPRERLLAWLRSREQGGAQSRKPLHAAPEARVLTALDGNGTAPCALSCASERPKRRSGRRTAPPAESAP